jgi:hypothetical protein
VASYEVTLVSRVPASSGEPTLTEVCGLKYTGISYEDEAGAPGRFDVGASIDDLADDAKTRLIDLVAYPCEVWIHREAVRVFTGPLTAWTIQGRAITLHGPGLLGYLNYWNVDEDQTFAGEDQATIVATLIDLFQARTYGSFGLDTGGLTATGVTRDLTLLGREGRGLLPVVQSMGERENGFELSIDPASRAVTLHTPRRGIDRSTVVYLDRRNIGSPRLFASVAPGQFATDVAGASSSADGGALTSSAENATARTTFGRAQVAKVWSDVKVQTTLDDHTRRVADDLATMRISVDPQLVPVEGADVTDFDAGDVVTYDFDSGLGTMTSTQRIRAKRVTVGRTGREELSVRFV